MQARGGLNDAQAEVLREAIAVLTAQGATIVDPADIPSVTAVDPERNILLWSICSGATQGRGKDEECSIAFKYGMKRDFNQWLASLGTSAPVKTLTDLRAWNTAHRNAGALKYGQSNLDVSDEMDLERDRARYVADRQKDVRLTGAEGIDAVMARERLDALLFPASIRCGAGGTARISDRDRAVRPGAELADAALPRRIRGEGAAVWGELYGRRVQRAAAARTRVCVRAGDPPPRASTRLALTTSDGTGQYCNHAISLERPTC